MDQLPESVKNLLWDVDPKTFSAQRYADFLAVRIAEKGNLDSLSWFITRFGLPKLVTSVLRSPETRPATKKFWSTYAE